MVWTAIASYVGKSLSLFIDEGLKFNCQIHWNILKKKLFFDIQKLLGTFAS